ncbi:MAG TPA: BRO family protein [Candidatus Hodarchaeales archaeon]|nr:BRO family protein [Candidatus Hodarchaeales archaeon]
MEEQAALAVFQGKKIRRLWYNDQWWFSIVDVVGALSESEDSRNYWKVLKHRLKDENSEVVTKCNQLKLLASDGKYYLTDCANTEILFRIIQSIPSKNAEPFKLWLAKVGYERIQEIENPELAQERMKLLYEQKGYSKDWIEKRLRGIAIRQELTGEWKQRGVNEQVEFAILTNEISKAPFGKTVDEYKTHKNLKKENLRDHMNDWELIFTMLGEKATTDITKTRDAQGFDSCKQSAQRGGQIAKNARNELERETGESIISKDNFLTFDEKRKIPQRKKPSKG